MGEIHSTYKKDIQYLCKLMNCEIQEYTDSLKDWAKDNKGCTLNLYINENDKELIKEWKEKYKYAKTKNITFFTFSTSSKEIKKLIFEKRKPIYEFFAQKENNFSLIIDDDKIIDILTMFQKKLPMLLLGERGTGKTTVVKEFMYEYLKYSQKTDKIPYRQIVCGQLSNEQLAESKLFGHTKGAFTGADSDRTGLIKECENGILFLDEIQDLPKTVQRKLLDFLQNKSYYKIGEAQETKIENIHLVFASNLPLNKLLQKLDYDFFDRICTYKIEMDSLSSKKEKIKENWDNLWNNYKIKNNKGYDFVCPFEYSQLEDVVAEVPLNANYRDIEKLIAYIDLYIFDEEIYDTLPKEEKKKKLEKVKDTWKNLLLEIDAAQKSTQQTSSQLNNIIITEEDIKQHSWKDWNKLFKQWLHQQALRIFQTDSKAAQELKTTKSTFQNKIYK